MKLVFSTWIFLLRIVLGVSSCCIICKSKVVVIYWVFLKTGKIRGLLSNGGIVWDNWVPFNFYVYFCAHQIRSIKSLSICVIEKILIFATVDFSKIHSCLSVGTSEKLDSERMVWTLRLCTPGRPSVSSGKLLDQILLMKTLKRKKYWMKDS